MLVSLLGDKRSMSYFLIVCFSFFDAVLGGGIMGHCIHSGFDINNTTEEHLSGSKCVGTNPLCKTFHTRNYCEAEEEIEMRNFNERQTLETFPGGVTMGCKWEGDSDTLCKYGHTSESRILLQNDDECDFGPQRCGCLSENEAHLGQTRKVTNRLLWFTTCASIMWWTITAVMFRVQFIMQTYNGIPQFVVLVIISLVCTLGIIITQSGDVVKNATVGHYYEGCKLTPWTHMRDSTLF